ncbi:MAG: D-glycerate dehydrogenase [Cyclobacteriaceae bacterium]|nr:D-glycerate dehydrogenase [Cyclobacteriaceae bacterium]
MQEKIKILVSAEIPEKGIEMLKDEGFVVTVLSSEKRTTQEDLIAHTQDHQVLLSLSSDKLDSHFINACSHLKMISQLSVGYDNIDLDTATRLKIPVGNAPDAMTEATADVAFGLMINVARKMFYMHKRIIAGNWGHFQPKANLGIELKNKTLGIMGLGRIGTAMAERCVGAYKMQVIYHNRTRNDAAENNLNARLVSFEELLAQSDVLSVHCTLNPCTKEIFNQQAFQKMKKSAIFINTSRGTVHHEKDLEEALKNGDILGAGLDVTNPEPMQKDNPLLSMANVAILPHIGSATIEARTEMSRLAAINIIEYFRGNKIPHLLNKEVMVGM